MQGPTDSSVPSGSAPPQQSPHASQPESPTMQRDRQEKLDAFHGIQRYGKGTHSQADPSFACFMNAIAAAFFLLNEEDVNVLKRWLTEVRGMTTEEIKKLPRAYFVTSKHVRGHIPGPLELAKRLSKVIAVYEKVLMADGRQLFRTKKTKSQECMRDIHKGMLKHALAGCISDPPGMDMYMVVGHTPSGLPIYKCKRGSSQLEVRSTCNQK